MPDMPKLPDIPVEKVVKAGKSALEQLEKSGQEEKVVEVVSRKTGIKKETINSALKAIHNIK